MRAVSFPRAALVAALVLGAPLLGALGLGALGFAPVPLAAERLALEGAFVQGGLVVGRTQADAQVSLDGAPVRVGPDGLFLLGFGREAAPSALLELGFPDGTSERRALAIAQRSYTIQRIDGLPENMVSPSAEEQARIEAENRKIAAARARDTEDAYFLSGFAWPAEGSITGVYGTARVLNGEPRQPHYGVDIAAPEGAAVVADADGVVALAEPDLFFTGGTVILDHGFGLSSAFSHLSEIAVSPGQFVRWGQVIGRVGRTGRATAAHLDWRINLFDRRLDPALLVPPMPAAEAASD